MDQVLTIITPVSLTRRKKDILSRVKLFIKTFENSKFQLIIGTDSKIIKNLSENLTPNIIISYTPKNNSINLSKLRNIAIEKLDSTHVLFLDIDLHIDLNLLEKLYKNFLASNKKIQMYPCLYLSKKGTKLISKIDIEEFINLYLNYSRDIILHLAFPSSIILCKSSDVKEINGFNEDYSGHGYEDFDFIYRLLKINSMINTSPFTLKDQTYLAPLLCTGFRADFSINFINILKTNFYFLHKYHKKNKSETYYQLRNNNREKFLKYLENNIDSNHNLEYFYLPRLFQQSFETHDEFQKYSVLWAEIPTHKFRPRKNFIDRLWNLISKI